ncbi:cyclic nucleotide-binding domain-containing protein [Chryseobacterium manosquense]|uniref:Cyclic nucleotide-binding domain-containing protein n=1 Tax=Chryseobacterium manosquense TaxID=2754694 RepID=A0A7H1DXR7_9FLAO|nr:cyclic nucleotide-binding domain-containing protein [Chryseobacterium manosquense]QNS41775.1 cyclic nucleotide-binding domain-containing protein [Chryseobacterium manosquense]
MNHEKLINLLKQYGTISETEQQNIENYFIPTQVKRKQVLIEKNSPCNKLFFINSGLLRAYYINEKGKEVTRMFAWEGRFLTNIGSFKILSENNETIECVKDANILSINRDDFERFMKSSLNIKSIYADLLEKYNILHIKRFEALHTFDLEKKLLHLKLDFPNLINDLNDNLLASFLGISRIHFANNKHLLHK